MADQIDSRAALWAAVQAIMVKEYGRENINQFSKKTKVSLATIGRIKSQTTPKSAFNAFGAVRH